MNFPRSQFHRHRVVQAWVSAEARVDRAEAEVAVADGGLMQIAVAASVMKADLVLEQAGGSGEAVGDEDLRPHDGRRRHG